MSAPTTHRVVDPWWWPEEQAVPARTAPVATVLSPVEDGRVTVRVAADATPDDLRGVVSAAAARPACHTVALDLARAPRDAVFARAIAAVRVRLLVRGLRVELVDAPAGVLAAVGPDAPECYRVVDGPVPRRRTGVRRPAPRAHRGAGGVRAPERST